MIVKLQAGMMPPRAAQKPAPAAHAALVAALEHNLDAAAASAPNPGRRTFQRMNRPEYERAIKELLALDVNAGDWLPLDTKSANFDNIADAQALSPTLLESYLNAATAISRMAVGDRTAPTIDTTYTSPSYLSQHPWDHVEGAPYGTRGGIVVKHVFPADAEYEFQLVFKSGENARFEDVDVSIDGERIALLNYELAQVAGADGRGQAPLKTEPILVRAGQHQVSAAFIRRTEGPYEDLIKPHGWSYAGGGFGRQRDYRPCRTCATWSSSGRTAPPACRNAGAPEDFQLPAHERRRRTDLRPPDRQRGSAPRPTGGRSTPRRWSG